MGIPRMTRILLIPDDERRVREYRLSRAMAVTLASLAVAAAGALIVLFVTLASQQNALRRFRALEGEMAAARQDIATIQVLRRELEDTRRLQDRLLAMLGIVPMSAAGADSSAATGYGLAARRLSPVPAAPGPQDAGGAQFRWPAAGFVTREFAEGPGPLAEPPHPAIDIAGAQDTPILAAADGLVVRAGEDKFLGNSVEIQHGLGYLTVYGHCARLAVKTGDRVRGGQVIAYMGKSGAATATHLHFEVWRDGAVMDPRRVLSGHPPQK